MYPLDDSVYPPHVYALEQMTEHYEQAFKMNFDAHKPKMYTI